MSALRAHPGGDSSSSPETVPAAFMMANARDGEEADLFIKDESSSPTPEIDKPRFHDRRLPSKFQSGAPRRISGAQTGRAATTVTKSSRSTGKLSGKSPSKIATASGLSKGGKGSPPSLSGNPVIPRKAEDWEPWKGVLHELYITQNRILKDIIVIMETNYNLRATPKMYKNQFARWNFFKYAVKKRPRNGAEGDAEEGRDDTALVTTGRSPVSIEDLLSPLLHESNKARVMQSGLTAVRDFLRTYIEIDPTAREDMVVIGYQDPCFRYFKTAMDLFEQNEVLQGGLLLRRAFLQIETMMSSMTIKFFSDLCFLVPHLLIESGRLDILAVYLRYLAHLVAVKFRSHPLGTIIASFADLLDEPDTAMRYIMALSEVNSDTLANLEDAKERTRKWARNQYIACQRTNLDTVNGASGSGKHAHHMMRVESQSVYWAQHLIMGDPESDRLAELWMYRDFPDDFGPRCEAYIEKVKVLGEANLLPPEYARMMECLYIGWLNDYYETLENWPRMFEYGRRGLQLASAEQYQIWSIHLEGLMRKHGTVEEAEELRKKRLEHEWFETVQQEVERLTLDID